VLNLAFVDALHGSFLISAIALLVIALLVAFSFRQKQPQTTPAIEPAVAPATRPLQPIAVAVTIE